MARPTKMTEQNIADILAVLEIGVDFNDACDYVGIAYDTFNEWRKKGELDGSGKYFEFSEAVKRAVSTASVNHQKNINHAAAKGDWKASLEFELQS